MSFKAPVATSSTRSTDIVGVGALAGAGALCRLRPRDPGRGARGGWRAGQRGAGAAEPPRRPGGRALRERPGHRAAPGFAAAYKAFSDGGWGGLAADPAFGGQGLPKAVELAVYEMIHAANMAFGLCPMLTSGAIEALHAHGDERQKALYLPQA